MQNVETIVSHIVPVWELVLRLVVASLAGAIVGYERKRRQKEAGIRTHLMVALGAAIFTIVSKYGFAEMVLVGGFNQDVSRIAANIVTGVSFLGAGMIFVRSKSITGLTTAAGIWAVSAIGLAFGSGMYIVGSTSTVVMILVQYALHKPLLVLEGPSTREVTMVIYDHAVNLPILKRDLMEYDEHMFFSNIEKREDKCALVKVNIRASHADVLDDIYKFITEHPYVRSISNL